MKALILNSGLGSRMGDLTRQHPKCMTAIHGGETILSRQLRQLSDAGIRQVVMTTGAFDQVLRDYCSSLALPLDITFVMNPRYSETNYIYSIYCAREHLADDILLMHGDLVFEDAVLADVMAAPHSCMAVSSTLPLPEKDFKAVVEDGHITRVGIEFFDHAMAAQPLYKLCKEDWLQWLDAIARFVDEGTVKVYAENAFNQVSDACRILPLDVLDSLCGEIDTPADLEAMNARLDSKTVYMCFSADMIHSGHVAIIRKAARLGRLVIGVLSDEAVASFKRFPLMPYEERRSLFASLAGVD